MFRSARLRLTFWYLVILATVCWSFSVVIYSLVNNEVSRLITIQKLRIEQGVITKEYRIRFEPPIELNTPEHLRYSPDALANPGVQDEVRHRLLLVILATNSTVLTLSGFLAYWLAGRTLRPIQQMLEEQRRFVTDASHQLRTPLTAMKSGIEVSLRDPNLSLTDAKQSLKENLNDLNRLQLLTDGLLRLAQYRSSPSSRVIDRVELHILAEEVVRQLHPSAKNKQIRLHTTLQQVTACGNRGELHELMSILLDNAIKYSPPKSTIRVLVYKTERKAFFAVQDEGIGIAPTDVAHIFDRFYRASNTRGERRATQEHGYGLGLSIAKEIARSHHGELTVKSEVDKGSTFILCLPLRRAQNSA